MRKMFFKRKCWNCNQRSREGVFYLNVSRSMHSNGIVPNRVFSCRNCISSPTPTPIEYSCYPISLIEPEWDDIVNSVIEKTKKLDTIVERVGCDYKTAMLLAESARYELQQAGKTVDKKAYFIGVDENGNPICATE